MNIKLAHERAAKIPTIVHQEEGEWCWAKGYLEFAEQVRPLIIALDQMLADGYPNPTIKALAVFREKTGYED